MTDQSRQPVQNLGVDRSVGSRENSSTPHLYLKELASRRPTYEFSPSTQALDPAPIGGASA